MWVSDASSRQKCTHLLCLTRYRKKQGMCMKLKQIPIDKHVCDLMCCVWLRVTLKFIAWRNSFNHRRRWGKNWAFHVMKKSVSVILSRFQFEWLFPIATAIDTQSRFGCVCAVAVDEKQNWNSKHPLIVAAVVLRIFIQTIVFRLREQHSSSQLKLQANLPDENTYRCSDRLHNRLHSIF